MWLGPSGHLLKSPVEHALESLTWSSEEEGFMHELLLLMGHVLPHGVLTTFQGCSCVRMDEALCLCSRDTQVKKWGSFRMAEERLYMLYM